MALWLSFVPVAVKIGFHLCVWESCVEMNAQFRLVVCKLSNSIKYVNLSSCFLFHSKGKPNKHNDSLSTFLSAAVFQ